MLGQRTCKPVWKARNQFTLHGSQFGGVRSGGAPGHQMGMQPWRYQPDSNSPRCNAYPWNSTMSEGSGRFVLFSVWGKARWSLTRMAIMLIFVPHKCTLVLSDQTNTDNSRPEPQNGRDNKSWKIQLDGPERANRQWIVTDSGHLPGDSAGPEVAKLRGPLRRRPTGQCWTFDRCWFGYKQIACLIEKNQTRACRAPPAIRYLQCIHLDNYC
ncbi:hypothetical protein ASPSYDRAFT_1055582 [Aspergillus sydowii CBS 593.65]|uniref:Uncharacterized protein n=1 Tax=Aspergillus sydowii CBS 593.65 TaxID=1036612 RepID=A0A1L9TDG7_9EURO|nr:uncharacterized protein ASPSYDRAFT_1055582 [Aspergillus sydowii CBS 593.65]OJJ57467.1 hypothetical protein ASPSYDRAFT_1055582 [Aspergillus sydowii CBS 593.65]